MVHTLQKMLLIFFCIYYIHILHFLGKQTDCFPVKGQHMNFIDVTMWGLQVFPWLLPNLMVTISCRVLGFPVWPEARGGELCSCQLHLCALWFDCHCGDSETARIMALPLHLWRKSPMPLCTRLLDRVSLSIVLRPLHQVTLCPPSLTFPTDARPMGWWRHQEAGWMWPLHSCWGNRSIVDSSQAAYQSIFCLFKCSREHLKNLPSKQPALFLLRF